MQDIEYVVGDATHPAGPGPKVLCHVCNDVGAWGSGFVRAISARWKIPEAAYRKWHRLGPEHHFGLGEIQVLHVEDDIWVANMVAQLGVRGPGYHSPIRYDALEQCLERVAEKARKLLASVHMPRIGCGLAGGTWGMIEPILIKTLCEKGIAVTVYDWPPSGRR